MREADLTVVSDLLPVDLELDPAAARYGLSDERISRGIITHQGYWKAYGTWQPSAWRLGFVASAAGGIVGFQELEGNDIPLLRTGHTSPLLSAPDRRRRYGKPKLRPVLPPSCGPL